MSTIDVKDASGSTVTVAKVANTGTAAASDSLPVTLSTEDKALLAVGAATILKAEDAAHSSGDAGIMALAVRRDADTTLVGTDGDYAPVQVNAAGAVKVALTAAIPAGANVIGTVTAVGPAAENAAASGNPLLAGGRYDASPRNLGDGDVGALALDSAGRAQIVGSANMAAAATGGYTPGSLRSGASNNATTIKASAGTLGFLGVINTTATLYYLKFYDKASNPAPGSDNGLLKGVYPIPADTTGAGIMVPIPPQGLAFGTGIAFALVAGASDTDNTNAATGVFINYGFN